MNVGMFCSPHFLRVNLFFGNLIHVYKIFWWLSPLPSHTWQPYSSLQVPLPHSWFLGFFCDALTLARTVHMTTCLELSIWAWWGSSVGTQQLPLPENPSVGSSSAGKGMAHEASPVRDWRLTIPAFCKPKGGNCQCCEIMLAMAVFCPEDSIPQPLLPSSYALSFSPGP